MKIYVLSMCDTDEEGNDYISRNIFAFFSEQEALNKVEELEKIVEEYDNIRNEFWSAKRTEEVKRRINTIPSNAEEAANIARENFLIDEYNKKIEENHNSVTFGNLKASGRYDISLIEMVEKGNSPEYYTHIFEVNEVELIHKNMGLE